MLCFRLMSRSALLLLPLLVVGVAYLVVGVDYLVGVWLTWCTI